MSQYTFTKAKSSDIKEVSALYNDLNDYLEATINYPNWKKGIYPTEAIAKQALDNENLFILKQDTIIVGSVVLSHVQEHAYQTVSWGNAHDYLDILVIYTFVIHPCYLKLGLGQILLDNIKKYAYSNYIKAIRLDVSEHNTPAIALYKKCGYNYIATVDLGLDIPNLKWFELYQLEL